MTRQRNGSVRSSRRLANDRRRHKKAPRPIPHCCAFLVGLGVHVDQVGLGDAVQVCRLGEWANPQDVTVGRRAYVNDAS